VVEVLLARKGDLLHPSSSCRKTLPSPKVLKTGLVTSCYALRIGEGGRISPIPLLDLRWWGGSLSFALAIAT